MIARRLLVAVFFVLGPVLLALALVRAFFAWIGQAPLTWSRLAELLGLAL